MLAGKEYGSGSSRDWAAKGTALLGVKAVIAESYERIHRSNLIGMGVLPLQFPEGQNRESLGLTGDEEFTITGITALNDGSTPRTVQGQGRRTCEFDARVRIDTPGEANYYRNGGIMQYVLRSLRRRLIGRLMDLGLGGRGYLLTGASRGLGFATARALVDDGARVLISSRVRGVGRRRRSPSSAVQPARPGVAADLADPEAARAAGRRGGRRGSAGSTAR